MSLKLATGRCLQCTWAQLWNNSRDISGGLVIRGIRSSVLGAHIKSSFLPVQMLSTRTALCCFNLSQVRLEYAAESARVNTDWNAAPAKLLLSNHKKSLIRRPFTSSCCLLNDKKDVRPDEAPSEGTIKDWKKDAVFTVPNALTMSRIVLSPVLGYMVLNGSFTYACGIFVYAGITDLLDGLIARKYPSQSSVIGSFIDPLADKFLVSILFLSLTAVDLIPVVLTALVILRDVLLVGAAFYVRYITLPPPKTISRYFDVTHATVQLHPTFISKLNTTVQLTLVATTLAAPILGYVDHLALQCLWYLTAATTISSGITYMFAKDTFKIIRETKKQQK